MRSIRRDVNGFLFGFTYGDYFGESGLVIPPNIDIVNQSPDLPAALVIAQQMSNAFYSICFVLDFVESNSRIELIAEFDLSYAWKHAVAAYSQSHWDLDEFGEKARESINWVCDNAMVELQRRQNIPEPQKEPKKQSARTGYVYLIQSPTGTYKIGRTVDPDNRMKTFTVKLPFEVEYVCTIQTEDMHALEKQLHGHFASKRVSGEWFSLTPDDVEYIKGLAL